MPNLGLGEERLHELNPSLVYVTMPGYGRTGPARDYSAYGPVLDSHAGLSTLMGYPDRDAWKCGIAWPDPVAGIHAAYAVLAALWQRDLDPAHTGTTIEVAQFETAVSMVGDRLVRAQLDGANPPILGNRHPEWAPQGVYAGFGDDRWLALTVPDDDRWAALCELLGLPAGWGLWDVADRRMHHDEIDAAITAWSAGQDHKDAAAALQAVGVPAAPVADAQEMVEDPHLAARGFFDTLTQVDTGPLRWHGLPVRLSGTPAQLRRPPARLGEHNREILRDWAGMDDATIDALIAAGTLADEPPV
jgi:benzylsuccinate CoA-transferase BbsF subunit